MANLKLLGASSGYTELAAASVAVPTTFTLPAADGTAGQILSTNGSGQLQNSEGNTDCKRARYSQPDPAG